MKKFSSGGIRNNRSFLKILFILFFLLIGYEVSALDRSDVSLDNSLLISEKVESFDVEIKINQDSSINISEKIEYDFANLERHGIFRDIPVKYQARGGNYNLRISDISVSDESGNPYNYQLSYPGNNIEIKIGDADKLVSGRKAYVIKYKIKRAINYFNDGDELYWNVTGNGWVVPIEKSSARLIFPESLPSGQIRTKCYFGVFGSSSECGSSAGGDLTDTVAYFENKNVLASREGMTIVVGFPKGIVTKPSIVKNILDTMTDNLILFLPFVVFAYMFYRWRKYGRDPQGRGTIIAQYDAPDNLSPAEVGTVLDESADNRDISATIIHLAVRGYLKISKIKKEGFISKSDDYQLDKLKSETDLGEEFERTLMQKLFNNNENVKLSELKNEFYKDLEKIKGQVYQAVVTKRYYDKNPSTARANYIIAGIAVVFLIAYLGYGLFGSMAIFSGTVSGIIIIGFGWFMPSRTKKGVLAKEHILGLKEYLTVAEKDRINFHNAPEKNPEHFEKLLPFAIVLKVEKKWAEQFRDIYVKNPSWYNDSSTATFNSIILANSLTNFSDSANSVLASSPSSASGGGSGFSGGGSGGGFGGGGGGSW